MSRPSSTRRVRVATSARPASISSKSPPAENTLPVEASTTARRSVRLRSSSRTPVNASWSSTSNRLRTSGRVKVISATAPSTVRERVSLMAADPVRSATSG